MRRTGRKQTCVRPTSLGRYVCKNMLTAAEAREPLACATNLSCSALKPNCEGTKLAQSVRSPPSTAALVGLNAYDWKAVK